MFGIGMPEFIIIMVIILIILGVGKLPEIGAGMGKAIRNFKAISISCRTKLCAYNLLRNLPNMVVFQS